MPRKKANIHYLYKTTCVITGRYYIGMHSTTNLNDGYMGSGKRLRYSIRKYGKENHIKEILEFFDSRELLVEAEKTAITTDMLCDKMCMNIMSGGTGGDTFSYMSDEKKKIILDNLRFHSKERWLSSDFRKKIHASASNNMKKAHSERKIKYDTFTGRKHKPETIEKMRKSKGIGHTNSQYGTMWVTNGIENKKIKKEDIIPEGWCKGRK